LEVSSRRLPSRSLLVAASRLAVSHDRLALAATLAVALGFALSQPVASPWWIYADADATYVASAANLMAGEHTFYLDHPGLPLQDLMAVTFETRYLAEKILGGDSGPHAFAAERMLKLDASRVYWRTYAVLFYLFGAGVAFIVCSRFLGHWGWGIAGGLMWTAAPGLTRMAIQYRPDVLLAGLVLVVGYLIVRAAERRDAGLYSLAALLLGLTITVKMHAGGLLVPLAVALLIRPPGAGWPRELATRAGATLWRRRRLVIGLAAGWIALAVAFNSVRFPLDTYDFEHRLFARAGVLFGAYLVLSLLCSRLAPRSLAARLLSPFAALVALLLTAGMLLPATLFLDDGLLMLWKIEQGLTGGGINESVEPFAIDWGLFGRWPLREALVVFAVAGIAAAVGILRREPAPVLWFAGAAATGVMATARLATWHYFAPAFVLSIPAALWLLRRRCVLGAATAAVLVAYVIVPQLRDLTHETREARAQERRALADERVANDLLQPGQVVLTDSDTGPDVRWLGFGETFVSFKPAYPYRFLPDSPLGRRISQERGLRPVYLLTSSTSGLPGRSAWRELGVGSRYLLQPLLRPAVEGSSPALFKLVAGEGVDRPYGHPEARYDPWTGYYKDRASRYYDLFGNEVESPARRRYFPKLRLWLDAYGDFWNENGKLVMSRPELRTAP